MSTDGNPFSSIPNPRRWKSCLTLDVFLSHSSDCLDVCEAVKTYLQDDINNALREYNLTITPIMYENWPPSLRVGNATTSSLAELEISSIVFAFIYKKHGKIRNEEIFYAIQLCKEKKIQDVHVFFRKVPWFHITREDNQVISLRKKLEENLTHFPYESHEDVIKKVSQIIIKAICEIKKLEGAPRPEERLLSGGGEQG